MRMLIFPLQTLLVWISFSFLLFFSSYLIQTSLFIGIKDLVGFDVPSWDGMVLFLVLFFSCFIFLLLLFSFLIFMAFSFLISLNSYKNENKF